MKHIALFILLTSYFNAQAKIHNPIHSFREKYSRQITLYNSAISMPPHFINGRWHPGLNLCLDKMMAKRHGFKHQYALGYFAQRSLQRVAYIKGGMAYRYTVWNNLYLQPSLNLSVMDVRNINKEFKFENGHFKELSRNRLQLMPSFGMELGSVIGHSKHADYGVLFRYEFGVQLPFSQISVILPMNQLHVGFFLQPLKK